MIKMYYVKSEYRSLYDNKFINNKASLPYWDGCGVDRGHIAGLEVEELSLLYKRSEDMVLKVEIIQNNGVVEFLFEKDCGKHGVFEPIDGYNLTPARLLQILGDRNDYTDEEL